MGGMDKATIVAHGRRLIDHCYNALSKQTSYVLINGRQSYGYEVDVVADDPNGPQGPLGGIFSVLSWLSNHRNEVSGIVTIPVDCPMIPEGLVARLSANGLPTIANIAGSVHPVIGYWPLGLLFAHRDEFFRSENLPVQVFANAVGANEVNIPNVYPFHNINCPLGLAAFKAANYPAD